MVLSYFQLPFVCPSRLRPNGPPSISPGHRPGYIDPIISAPQRGAIPAHPANDIHGFITGRWPTGIYRIVYPARWAGLRDMRAVGAPGMPALAIGCITGWPTATIRNLAAFPALAILRPREASWSAAVLCRFCCQPTGHCDNPLAVSRRPIRSLPDHAPGRGGTGHTIHPQAHLFPLPGCVFPLCPVPIKLCSN
jgi:hypothetical protein